MSEILFVTWDGGGNVGPAVEMAHELQRRGHGVRFLGQAQQGDALRGAGFGFGAFTRPGPWTAIGRRGPVANAVAFLRLLTGRNLGRDMLADIAAAPTDIVVIDCLLFGAMDVASRAGLAYAVLVHSLYEAIDAKMAGGAPGVIARLRGLRPRKLWAGAGVLVVATLRELDRPRSAPPSNARYTGPALSGAIGSESRAGHPRLLVSLSTTYLPGQGQVLQNILDAVGDLEVDVVVTTGPAIAGGALRIPANAEVHDYLPHAELLPTMSLVIGHGGHSTTMLALAHDVPLVILPMNLAFDQPLVGAAIQRAGAGITIASGSSVDEIRAAVSRALGDVSFAREAARLGASIREHRGVEAAADLLLTQLTERKRAAR
jgi:UDP:flavonoid glycosyltransferase YjiC (YdhE family)